MSTLTTSAPSPGRLPRSRLSTARSALALLREQSWWGALLGVIVLSVIFVFLGRWQYHRHEAKVATRNLVNRNFNAAPVPLTDLIPLPDQTPGATLPKQLRWRSVQVTGTYLSDRTILIRNRPHDQFNLPDDGSGDSQSQNGYEVVVPLQDSQNGQILLVDRGWIPAGTASAARPDSVPAAPAGQVTVVARLQPSEPRSSHRAPAGQSDRINIPRLATMIGSEHVVGAYGDLRSETPPASNSPAGVYKPQSGLGVNLAYAVQWVIFAITAYVLLGVAMVREVRRRDDDEPPPVAVAITRATYR
jgi:cytochrome oxidase assembly protein ShyY1